MLWIHPIHHGDSAFFVLARTATPISFALLAVFTIASTDGNKQNEFTLAMLDPMPPKTMNTMLQRNWNGDQVDIDLILPARPTVLKIRMGSH